jgi:hypothetical protein
MKHTPRYFLGRLSVIEVTTAFAPMRAVLATVAVLGFAPHAQAQDAATANALYNAALQMQAENATPNWPAGARHALMIMALHGVNPGFDPGELNASTVPEGPPCIWFQGPDGAWRPRCSENYTWGQRCSTARQIRDMELLRDGAFWGSWIYQWAAIYVGVTGNVPGAALLGGVSLLFDAGGWAIDRQLGQHLANKCPGNENDPQ